MVSFPDRADVHESTLARRAILRIERTGFALRIEESVELDVIGDEIWTFSITASAESTGADGIVTRLVWLSAAVSVALSAKSTLAIGPGTAWAATATGSGCGGVKS